MRHGWVLKKDIQKTICFQILAIVARNGILIIQGARTQGNPLTPKKTMLHIIQITIRREDITTLTLHSTVAVLVKTILPGWVQIATRSFIYSQEGEPAVLNISLPSANARSKTRANLNWDIIGRSTKRTCQTRLLTRPFTITPFILI